LDFNLNINHSSRVPKYKQIVESIVTNISNGRLPIGQKIPSINELSESCGLSRDTVEKAYRELKKKKIIISVKGKGFYTAKTELSIYHCDESLFIREIQKSIGSYDYYVIMTHFKSESLSHISFTDETLTQIEKIPKDKLIILDNDKPTIKGNYGAIFQDFKNDIYFALKEGIQRLKKYDKLILVYPQKSVFPYPRRILRGFLQFCGENDFDHEILDEIYEDMELNSRDIYITIEEMDLVKLVQQVNAKKLTLGKDIGIISYNDTPLKSLLGITVISTDFKTMGETAAYMLLKNKKEKVKNVFKYIERNSV